MKKSIACIILWSVVFCFESYAKTPYLKKLDKKIESTVQAQMTPNYTNGKVDGFKAYGVKKDGLFDSLDINNGDVIHRVNDVKVDDAQDIHAVLAEFSTKKKHDLDISRYKGKYQAKKKTDKATSKKSKSKDVHVYIANEDMQAAVDDERAFFSSAKIEVNKTNGKSDGYKIYGIRPQSTFDRLGIKNGDVAHSFGKERVVTMYAFNHLLDLLREKKEFTIKVSDRSGEPRAIFIHPCVDKKACIKTSAYKVGTKK